MAITIHELSHGYVAYKLGDNTAKSMGRLTLNPIKHIDILGLAMIVLVGFGWAKPVPVDMHNFKHPKWHMAITAAAGPISNLILAVIAAFIFMLMPSLHEGYSFLAMLPELNMTFPEYAARFDGFVRAAPDFYSQPPIITLILHRMVLINVYLAIFNLLPIPPLDGSKVLFSLLPEKHYYTLMRYERFGMIFLIVLIFSGRFLNVDIFGIVIGNPAMSLLTAISEFAYNVTSVFA